jgi:hypothetical protein
MSKKKFDFSRGMKTVKTLITANSPVLLVGATLTGVVATGFLAAKGGWKARGIVDAAQAERGPEAAPLTLQEKTKLTWLCYAPAAIAGASAATSCLGVHYVHTKRFAELAGLYAITSGKLDDYKEKVEEALTGKKKEDFQSYMAQKSADSTPLVNNEVIITEGGKELYHDDFSGRWFLSSMAQVDKVVNDVNALFIDEGEMDLNTFYDHLGLPGIPIGTDFGWQQAKTRRIEVVHGTIKTPDGQAANTISFRHDPKPERGR